jgi:hypothetical protein
MKKILGFIIGAGFAFRLLFLGKRQLGTEELMQALASRSDYFAAMIHRFKGGIFLPAPLDCLAQRGLVLVLGDSAWILRLHAAVFGALSLWVFYRIARRLSEGRVALYATALMAIFPLHYHYSQTGEPFSLVTLLTLLSYDLLLRDLAEPPRGWRQRCMLPVAMVLLFYTSYLAFAVVATQATALLISRILRGGAGQRSSSVPSDMPAAGPRQIAGYILASVAGFLLFLPWILTFWHRPGLARVSDFLSLRLILRLIKELGDNSYPAAAIFLLGAAVGIRALLRHRKHQVLIWLSTWLAVSIPAVLMLDIALGLPFSIGQIVHVTPALVLLAGYGLSYLGERLTILEDLPLQLSSPAMVYFALILSMSGFIAYSHWGKESVDWSGTSRFLQENLRAGDRVAVPQGFALLEYYMPNLKEYGSPRLESVNSGEGRKFVVCLEGGGKDPCGSFKAGIASDRSWSRLKFQGLSLFARQK